MDSESSPTASGDEKTNKNDESVQNDSGVFDETLKSQGEPAGRQGAESPPITEEQQQLIDYAKSQFNINRKVIIRNIPPCTYNDVKAFLGNYAVKNILVSKRNRHAVVWLSDGSQAEEVVEALNKKEMLGQDVEVALFRNENFLCIAHLPLNVTDQDFKGLVTELGITERVFLMRDRKGRSKGYGFVEYSHNYEKTKQACNLLDGKRMGSCTLHCEFIKDTVLTFEQLNSSCLFVDHLPPGYDNFDEFNSIFSSVNKPIYCRLGIENEKPLGFGIVEYSNYTEAEEACLRLHGKPIKNHTIRVTYCIPGLSATEVYERQTRNLDSNVPRYAGLLPDPLGRSLAPSLLGLPQDALANPVLKTLLSTSPKVLDNFQSVLSRLQQHTKKHQDGGKPGVLGPGPDAQHNPLLNPNLQISILACILAHQLEENQPAIFSSPMVQQFLKSNSSLGAQIDADKPSLLGNPMLAQANRMLAKLWKEEEKATPDETVNKRQEISRPTVVTNALKDFKSLLNAVGEEKPPENTDKWAALGDGPPGDEPEPVNTVKTPPQNKEEEFGNPLLALIIETQIRQQLQSVQALSLLTTITGAVQPGLSDGRSSLLGSAPAAVAQQPAKVDDISWQDRFSGRRKPLIGDAPPGYTKDSNPTDYYQGQSDYRSRTEGQSQEGGRKEYSDWMAERYGSAVAPSNQAGDSNAMYQQMYQMYQQYLQQFSQYQQMMTPTGGTQEAEGDNCSDAVYSSGIANQPAYSTDMSYGKSTNTANHLTSFFSQLGQYGSQVTQNPVATGSTTQDQTASNTNLNSAASYQSSSHYQSTAAADPYKNQSQYDQSYQTDAYSTQGQSHSVGYDYGQSAGYAQTAAYDQTTSYGQGQAGYDSQHTSYGSDPYYTSQSYPEYDAYSSSTQQTYGSYSSVKQQAIAPPPPPPPPPAAPYSQVDNYSQSTYGAYRSSNSSSSDFSPSSVSTPVGHPQQGLKRAHLLPSPEPSPQGSYIGQHSQGLGGHYAASYKKRKL